MANANVNKVTLGSETLIDLTADTVTPSSLAQGYTAHDASGALITGTSTGGSMIIRDEEDSHGGTIRHITAGSVVTGTKTITQNGTHDVAQYADAIVNVPAPEPELQAKTATPTESQQTVTPDSGYDGLSQVTVNAISSSYVGSGIDRRDSNDITEEAGVFTIPAGYYAEDAACWLNSAVIAYDSHTISNNGTVNMQFRATTAGYAEGVYNGSFALPTQAAATITPTTSSQTAVAAGKYTTGAVTVAAMPAGTAGTPTATKGTVSNHSVSITPSVTNSAGYISGGTKTGTAVSVNASELVSGTLSITSSGTKDVTNYASASVAAGSATASATKGSVSNHSVTVTSSVTRTAGYVTAGTANGTAVTVSASELVSGTLEVTESGTYDVTNYASASVDVPSAGGGTIVTGTFTTGETRTATGTVSINYAGSGYPLAYVVYSNSTVESNDIRMYSAVKNTTAAPSWTTASDANNTSTVIYVYKTSTVNAATLATNAATHMGAQYVAAAKESCVKFLGSGATLGYYIGNKTSSTFGLAPSTTYNYIIAYSS